MNSAKRNPSDGEIIELYFARNEEAIDATDGKYGRYLSVIGYNILHEKWSTDEALNDTYYATWNRIPPERPNIFQAFLSKIMRNISISKFRKEHAKSRVSSELVTSLEELSDCIVSEASTEEDLKIKEIAEILNKFLSDIDKMKRFIFVCRYYYADSVKSIAGMLGMNQRTVYRVLEELRGELRERLEKEGITV